MLPTISARIVQRRGGPTGVTGGSSGSDFGSKPDVVSRRGRLTSIIAKTNVTHPKTSGAIVNGKVASGPSALPGDVPDDRSPMATATLTSTAPPSAIFSTIQ